MTHFLLDLLVQAGYDFQKDKNLRSQTCLEPLGIGAARGRLYFGGRSAAMRPRS